MSETEEWEVREEGTHRVLGTYTAATTPTRGDVIEFDGRPLEVRQVADIVAGDGDMKQRGWLIVSI